MLYVSRRFSVVDVATAEDLAAILTDHTWCLCCGFRLVGADLLFLNDSTGPDGIQEYAVVRESSRSQIESVTFGWCDRGAALRYIGGLASGSLGSPFSAPITNRLDTPQTHGRCGHCA
jgi:hypothetical protein